MELFFLIKSRSFVNKLLTMQHYQAYLHQKLDSIYPLTEIGSFSRLLLSKLANMSSVQIYSDKDRNFPQHTLDKLVEAIDRLACKEPIQYILGETEFYSLTFHVGPGVLIPRPETEELVELITRENRGKVQDACILDIGTGSGCIAVSLAKAIPHAKVSAWDISPEALKIATVNADVNHVDVHFELIDVLHFVPGAYQKNSLDIMVSNPPYIRLNEAVKMESNVMDYEPHVALFVENSDPLIFYRVISSLAVEMLKPNGALYFEINSLLGDETLDLVKTFPFREVQLIQDLSGKDRMIRAYL
jgi:release factor glutamine methyltransferase